MTSHRITPRIRAVTFDCWGTLIADSGFQRSMARRVEAVGEAFGLDQQAAAELMDRAWREHHGAWLDVRQYGSSGMARFCHTELGIDDEQGCARLTEALEEAGRLGEQWALEGARDTLALLRQSGIRTALVCDAGFTPGRIVRDFLGSHGLLEHLEFCAFSNEVGVPKPHPEMFRVTLEALEVSPDEAVHVGDLLRTDIEGARSFGMRTIRITQAGDDLEQATSWVRSEATPAAPFDDADEIVGSHAEMPAALRRLGADLAPEPGTD